MKKGGIGNFDESSEIPSLMCQMGHHNNGRKKSLKDFVEELYHLNGYLWSQYMEKIKL